MSAITPDAPGDRRAATGFGPARISLERLFPGGLVVGLILAAISIFLMFDGEHRREMAQSYLFGYIFWMSVCLGCFGFMLLYHLLRAKWELPVLRVLEAGGGPGVLLVMALLFLPVALPAIAGGGSLYAWTSDALRHSDLILRHKAPYLNPGFWGFRYVFYFASWIAIAAWYRASTMRQERTGDPAVQLARNNTSGPFFIWFVLSVTFAMTDWVMSLDAHWYSTMYGLWSVVSFGIGGFTFAVYLFCTNAKRDPYRAVMSPKVTLDMGNILFVLTMLWAYTSLSQYLIIWSGNLPETNFYYVERSQLSWNLVGFVCIVGQFFLPFVMLLTPRNKRLPGNLANVCLFMFAIHLIDIYQYVIPALRQTGPMPTGYDALALVAIGLVFLGATAGVLRRRPLLPTFDNRLLEDVRDAH